MFTLLSFLLVTWAIGEYPEEEYNNTVKVIIYAFVLGIAIVVDYNIVTNMR